MDNLLNLLDKNCRMKDEQLSALLGVSPAEVEGAVAAYEKSGVIRGYKAIIDWDKTDREYVIARIEIRVIPMRDHGFDEIARTIYSFDEVETCYLMSGGYDLAVTVSGKSFKDVALFVSQKLAPIDAVQSTSTHFVLKKYKERGIMLADKEKDMREVSIL